MKRTLITTPARTALEEPILTSSDKEARTTPIPSAGTALGQPLELKTAVECVNEVKIGMERTYSFPFYRMTYTYDLPGNHDRTYPAGGLALQIRNASIQFKEVKKVDLYGSQNVDLVPALAIINGADFEFEDSILDASLRMSYLVREGYSLFANARFFRGTANGTSENVGET